MSRSHEYHNSYYQGGDDRSYMDDYLERINRLQRMPSEITDYHDDSDAKRVLNNNSACAEKRGDHHKKTFQVNHHQAPEMHKKVHFVEHAKTTEISRDGKREVYEEKTIDVEADGFIQQKHRNFDSCNTFKV